MKINENSAQISLPMFGFITNFQKSGSRFTKQNHIKVVSTSQYYLQSCHLCHFLRSSKVHFLIITSKTMFLRGLNQSRVHNQEKNCTNFRFPTKDFF